MAKGRSIYSFTVKDFAQAEAVIKAWLETHKFKPADLKGESVYLSKSLWSGRKYFTYKISGNEVKLYGWTHGAAGDFDFKTKSNQSVVKPFLKMLSPLFHELEALEN